MKLMLTEVIDREKIEISTTKKSNTFQPFLI